ncbi:glycosyltransferase family 39 protein [Streptomyces ortus]|uniref:Glycosyltransferase family 39 protein n=1 Tax=Streptomyces ortus TaxID=2867268 RepID=A0ABT3V8E6_9ACTN|nr:glycosyltransferase family 39 protein [Streptomyces ortus]MCX4236240.1 glycosyltransferase family 39 protein [Streptomyces ortus]
MTVKCSRGVTDSAVVVIVPGVVMLAIGLWGIDRGGMWRDEAVTFQVARRSLPQIWHLLHSVDAVHGLYYLAMHPVLAVHSGEVALRLPSLCAAAVTASLVAALGVRLARPRVGLWAGLLYAVTPMVGHFAQEGRSYAWVAAGVAASTVLLVRAAGAGRAVPRASDGARWCSYGGVTGVTVLLHEFAVLVLLAHALTLASARMPRRVWWAWGRVAGGVLLVLLPLALVSSGQAGQVAWLRAPGGEAVEGLLRSFTGSTPLVLGPYLLLIVLALVPRTRPARRGGLSLPAVALPLLLVPPATLLAVSRHWPLFDDRYVLYALAGAPLLAAAGAERVAGAAARLCGRRARWSHPYAVTGLGVCGVALAFVAQLPVLRADRDPARRPDNLAAVSAAAAERTGPGDPVLFLPALARRAAVAYPKGFRATADIALREPGPVSGTLYGRESGPGELRRRLDGLDRVWVIAEPYALRPGWYPPDPAEQVKIALLRAEFAPRAESVRKGSVIRLYVRRSAAAGSGARTGTGTGTGAVTRSPGSPGVPPRPARP